MISDLILSGLFRKLFIYYLRGIGISDAHDPFFYGSKVNMRDRLLWHVWVKVGCAPRYVVKLNDFPILDIFNQILIKFVSLVRELQNMFKISNWLKWNFQSYILEFGY